MCQPGGSGAWEPDYSQTVVDSSALHLLAVGEQLSCRSPRWKRQHLLFLPHAAVSYEKGERLDL